MECEWLIAVMKNRSNTFVNIQHWNGIIYVIRHILFEPCFISTCVCLGCVSVADIVLRQVGDRTVRRAQPAGENKQNNA